MYKIAIIMLQYGNEATSDASLKSIQSKIGKHQLILIDNNIKNVGFAKGVNQGIKKALLDPSITHIFLLNNDASISSGTLDQLLSTFVRISTAGIVAPVLHHHNLFDWGGKYNKWTGMVRHQNWENKPKTIQKVEHVAGAAMLIGRNVIEKIDTFDERFFLYFEDLDFCLRAGKAGFTIHINPDVVVEHEVSASTKPIARHFHAWRSHLLFISKYFPLVAYPTSFIYDFFFYPLVLLKLLVLQILHK